MLVKINLKQTYIIMKEKHKLSLWSRRSGISPTFRFMSAIFMSIIAMSYSFNSYAKSLDEVVVRSHKVKEQSLEIKGKVIDNYGEPIVGVTVVVASTYVNTITNNNGEFSIQAKKGDLLKFTLMGYVSQDVTIGDQNDVQVVLKEDVALLDEIVVIGYGTSLKSNLTGSLSQVGDESFEDQRVTRVDEALQGRAAGVQVTNTVGAPGGDVRIRIRGANSVLGDNSPLFVIDGFIGADFSLLNPNDIKSMEVLKDAASTAIYGSRGSNGVILITTKNGKKDGKVTVNYSGSVSVSTLINDYDLLSAGDFATLANEHDRAMGVENLTYTQSQIDDYYANGGFDYVDAIYRNAISNQHQLSISGGTEKTQYRISGNYLNQEGIVEMSKFDRYTFRTNINSKYNDKLSFRFNFNGGASNSYNNHARTGAGNPIVQAMAWAPTTNPYDGNNGYTISDPVGSIKTNPLAMIYDSENLRGKSFLNALGGVRYEIIEGLYADFQSSADLNFYDAKTWSGNYASNYQPSASKTNSKTTNVQTTTQLSYNKLINGVHNIDAVAVFETQSNRWESLNGTSSGLKFPDLKYDNLAQASSVKAGSDYSMWSLLSYLGRINYSYNSKYLVSLSVRHDGSSKFADGNKFGTFPAAAIAWNLANENFIKDLDIFSKLKLRMSWGLTGSQAVSPYATLSNYNSSIYYAFNTGMITNGIQLGNPGNLGLRWETTEQKDFGFEMGFFGGRLDVEFDYFDKLTRDLLLNQSVPYYQGGGSLVANVGDIRNSGVELTINSDIFDGKDFKWNTNFNMSYIKNEVKDLGEETQIFSNTNISGFNGHAEFVYQVGYSLGTFWGLKYLGPWQESEAAEAAKYGNIPGDARYEDLDGNYSIDGSDCQIIGDGMPDWTIGWNNSVTYKNFTLNAFFQGVFGVQKLNYTNSMHMSAARDARKATLEIAKDRYIPGVQEDAYWPAWSPTSKWEPQSTLVLEDASYVRLKNISIAYDFKVKNFANISISLNATNLLTITNYTGLDPEASNVGGGSSDIMQGIDYGAYPNSKTFTLGLDITF